MSSRAHSLDYFSGFFFFRKFEVIILSCGVRVTESFGIKTCLIESGCAESCVKLSSGHVFNVVFGVFGICNNILSKRVESESFAFLNLRVDTVLFNEVFYLVLNFFVKSFDVSRIGRNADFDFVFGCGSFAFYEIARFVCDFNYHFSSFFSGFAYESCAVKNNFAVVVERGCGNNLVVFIEHKFNARVDVNGHSAGSGLLLRAGSKHAQAPCEHANR